MTPEHIKELQINEFVRKRPAEVTMTNQHQTRIYIDFNREDEKGTYLLDTAGTRADLEKQHITLSEGLRLVFWSDDADEQGHPDPLVVEGVVEFSPRLKKWVARIDKEAIKHESEL
jgi:hypothetical protein